MNQGQILVVDDEDDIRSTISEILTDEGYTVTGAADAAAARAQVKRQRPDLILLDVWMPGVDGITLLREWTEDGEPGCPVVVLSGHGTVETAVEATRLGAFNFVEKPLSLAKLLRTVEQALGQRPGRSVGGRASFSNPRMPAGRSRLMQTLRAQCVAFATRPEALLIQGELGSGRQRVARYLHALGGTTGRPFESLTAAALPDENAALLLFGAAQTGTPVPGLLELAAGGTLFVGDVQDLGPEAQRLLAGVLEQRHFTPIGQSQAQKLTLRVVGSLDSQAGRALRPDLRARLATLEVSVPALRNRPEDVPELLRDAVERCVEEEGLTFRQFGLAGQNRLRYYPWPGNVRELVNLVRRLLLKGTGEISLGELEQELVPASGGLGPLVKEDFLSLPLRKAREKFERVYLTQQLMLCGGRVGTLAKRVGMERTHLYRKLRMLGVDFGQSHDEESEDF